MEKIIIRNIEEKDNAPLASVIRKTLEEYNANKPGTVYFDDTTDHLSEVFKQDQSCYFVAEDEGEVVGGAGIYPTEGLPEGTCELVKIYLSKKARGKGTGKMLLEKCLEQAREMGYKTVYLETMPELTDAIPLYRKYGFRFIAEALGNSGHTGCDLFMTKDLEK